MVISQSTAPGQPSHDLRIATRAGRDGDRPSSRRRMGIPRPARRSRPYTTPSSSLRGSGRVGTTGPRPVRPGPDASRSRPSRAGSPASAPMARCPRLPTRRTGTSPFLTHSISRLSPTPSSSARSRSHHWSNAGLSAGLLLGLRPSRYTRPRARSAVNRSARPQGGRNPSRFGLSASVRRADTATTGMSAAPGEDHGDVGSCRRSLGMSDYRASLRRSSSLRRPIFSSRNAIQTLAGNRGKPVRGLF